MNGRVAKQIRGVLTDRPQYRRAKKSYAKANKFQREKAVKQIDRVLELKKTGAKLHTLHIEEE